MATASAGRKAVIASPDHTLSSKCGRTDEDSPECRSILPRLRRGCKKYGVTLFDLNDDRQEIIHNIGPEQGLSLPGMTILCGDSHTCTHGALGVGTSEVYHVLATSCLWVRKPKALRIWISGERDDDIEPMDTTLHIIAEQGISKGSVMRWNIAGPLWSR
jgi:3-isopropylmalate/(R)-2-methylmalate dehydratase large subunit